MPRWRPVSELHAMLEDGPARLDDPRLDDLARLERRHAELRLLYDTIRDLGSTLSVREVLDRLLGRALDRLLAGRTALIIAHRLSTLARVDEVLIPEQGRVAECGPRAELERDPGSRLSQLLWTGLEEVQL